MDHPVIPNPVSAESSAVPESALAVTLVHDNENCEYPQRQWVLTFPIVDDLAWTPGGFICPGCFCEPKILNREIVSTAMPVHREAPPLES